MQIRHLLFASIALVGLALSASAVTAVELNPPIPGLYDLNGTNLVSHPAPAIELADVCILDIAAADNGGERLPGGSAEHLPVMLGLNSPPSACAAEPLAIPWRG